MFRKPRSRENARPNNPESCEPKNKQSDMERERHPNITRPAKRRVGVPIRKGNDDIAGKVSSGGLIEMRTRFTLRREGRIAPRLILSVIIIVSLLTCAGCTAFFVGGAITTSSTFQGTVSVVHLGDVNGNVQVTFVSFMGTGFSSSMNFCGNQVVLFPLNQLVQVNFNSGQPCATLLFVLHIG